MRRTARNCRAPAALCRSTTKLKGAIRRPKSRLVTYVPSPWRVSSTPIAARALTPSRSGPRETPSIAARSVSAGNLSPGRSSPERIMALIAATTSAVRAMARWSAATAGSQGGSGEGGVGGEGWGGVGGCVVGEEVGAGRPVGAVGEAVVVDRRVEHLRAVAGRGRQHVGGVGDHARVNEMFM